MSKSVKAVVITAAVIAQVEAVLQEKKANKYSTSRIYAAHNAVFGLNETPQSCASCLTKRARALEDWYAERENEDTAGDNPNVSEADKAKIEDAQTAAADAIKRTALAAKNKAGEAFDLAFASEDGEAGTVLQADGSAVKAGTYTLENGDTIAVQPGGKATYKSSIL